MSLLVWTFSPTSIPDFVKLQPKSQFQWNFSLSVAKLSGGLCCRTVSRSCVNTVGLVSLQALVAEQESKDSGGASIAEQVLSIMEIILDEANAEISEDKVRP